MQIKIKQVAALAETLKAPFNVSATPPENAIENELWLDSATYKLYIYIDDTNGPIWLEIA